MNQVEAIQGLMSLLPSQVLTIDETVLVKGKMMELIKSLH